MFMAQSLNNDQCQVETQLEKWNFRWKLGLSSGFMGIVTKMTVLDSLYSTMRRGVATRAAGQHANGDSQQHGAFQMDLKYVLALIQAPIARCRSFSLPMCG